MERIEYRNVVDKAGWPHGPWNNEPDKIQWQDEATGLPCLIVRGPSGALCGYVGVPEGHPLHGRDYDDVDIDVHGGLSFASACQADTPEDHGVCHRPSPGEPDHVWWLGFDCAHAGDFCPRHDRLRFQGDEYRDVAYVRQECQSLARQLINSAHA